MRPLAAIRASGGPWLPSPTLARPATPAVDAAVKPIIGEVVVPALSGVPAQLDEMGYGHRRDQYGQWQRWIALSIMGEAVHFLLEQGVLPPPPDPTPASFAFIAWKGDLALTSWGV